MKPHTVTGWPEADYDVIVVGCGPVGAAAANLLGVRGLRVLVLDKDIEPMLIPRAIHFDASIMRVFQSIGLAGEMEAHCRLIEQLATYGVDGQLLSTSSPGTGHDGWGAHYNFYQPELERILLNGLERFDRVELRRGAEVTAVDQDASGARVRWTAGDGEHEASAGYVIGTDGASSTIRKQLRIPLEDLDFDEPWLVVDAHVADGHGLPAATSQMFCDPRRPTTLVPGPGTHRRWEFMLLEGEDAAEMERPETITRLLATYVDPALVEIIRARVYRFHALVAERWQSGRVFLAGDAAHQTPPFLGQGMCHGIRDVEALAWRIDEVGHGATAELMDSYQDEREPQVRSIIERAVLKGREICILDIARARERDAAVAERSAWSSALDVTLSLSVDQGFVHPSRRPRATSLPQSSERGRRLDDELPAAFIVVEATAAAANGSAVDPLPDDGPFPRFRIRSAQAAQWLEEQSACWAILRPDRHPYAFACDDQELAQIEVDLVHRLGVDQTSRQQAAVSPPR